MEITVDQMDATMELNSSLIRARKEPAVACSIKPAIDFILTGKNCLTYRYILLTALTAKATNAAIDILSLQASDSSEGAYDARSLCAHVVFPFQREFLEDILDGSNEDPLVNNPGRHPRIDKSNKSANGDPRKALNMLCDYLPLITTSDEARDCLDYFISCCLVQIEAKHEQASEFETAILASDAFSMRSFMSSLLDKNFGGSALLMVCTSIFNVLFPKEGGYNVVPHPVNQSGTSSRQMSDLDIYNANGTPFLAIELKDKPFTETEVKKAAQTAFASSAPSMLFIAGRASSLSDETYRYFDEAKVAYEKKGMMIGVMTVDALLDYFFATNYRADTVYIMDLMQSIMKDIKASPEAMRWIYREVQNL